MLQTRLAEAEAEQKNKTDKDSENKPVVDPCVKSTVSTQNCYALETSFTLINSYCEMVSWG